LTNRVRACVESALTWAAGRVEYIGQPVSIDYRIQ
jgi:hypothetical protein